MHPTGDDLTPLEARMAGSGERDISSRPENKSSRNACRGRSNGAAVERSFYPW
jgi:hypothetical protein